jgi:hypothetical protein
MQLCLTESASRFGLRSGQVVEALADLPTLAGGPGEWVTARTRGQRVGVYDFIAGGG